MALASVIRQPFAELDSARLQSLSSTKNRQNALTDILTSAGKGKPSSLNSKIVLSSPVKRAHVPSDSDDDNEDAENMDPASFFSAKRSKNVDGTSSSTKKRNLFTLDVNASKTMSVSSPYGLSPTSPTPQKTSAAPFAFPSSPASAPASHLPKPKRIGALMTKKRSSLSPYKRIDPPSFYSAKKKPAALPFSLDAAISGTISKAAPTPKSSRATNLRESMPNGWFFDIHEDTPDEEAAILMEHSTCTLDISSDDEAGPARRREERGKENIPPSDLTSGISNDALAVDSVAPKPRRSVHADAMADVGEERAPLGSLPAEDFYAQGLDKDSVQVVTDGVAEQPANPSTQKIESALSDENSQPASEGNATTSSARQRSIDLVAPDFVIAEDPVDHITP